MTLFFPPKIPINNGACSHLEQKYQTKNGLVRFFAVYLFSGQIPYQTKNATAKLAKGSIQVCFASGPKTTHTKCKWTHQTYIIHIVGRWSAAPLSCRKNEIIIGMFSLLFTSSCSHQNSLKMRVKFACPQTMATSVVKKKWPLLWVHTNCQFHPRHIRMQDRHTQKMRGEMKTGQMQAVRKYTFLWPISSGALSCSVLSIFIFGSCLFVYLCARKVLDDVWLLLLLLSP